MAQMSQRLSASLESLRPQGLVGSNPTLGAFVFVIEMAVEIERYKKIYGEAFERKDAEENLRTVRVNTLKIPVAEMKKIFAEKNWHAEQIPFVDEGFWIKTADNISKTVEHQLGYFFSQNSGSMVPPLVLDAKEDEVILDLAASPGSKTTQLAAKMNNTGCIVANDIRHERLKALRGNLQRCGVMNAIVTKSFGEHFWKYGVKFGKILLDVPCTATGTFNPRIWQQTSESGIKILSGMQKKLLESAEKMLEREGVIVYSTCSLESEENEENIDFAVRKLGLSVEEIKLRNVETIAGVTEWNGRTLADEVAGSVRVVPSERMEGFFVCMLRK